MKGLCTPEVIGHALNKYTMKKTTGIPFVLTSTVLQLLMTLVAYWVLYGLARIFHEPTVHSGDGMNNAS